MARVPDDVAAQRLRLLADGYTPLPAIGKAVLLSNWVDMPIDAGVVRSWEERAEWPSTGIRTGTIVGVDIDIMDAAKAERAKNLALQVLGNTPLVRIGQSPKHLLVYRVTTPFKKKWILGEIWPATSKPHKIEVLADGQQFLAYGVHPDTQKPYVWPEADLCSIPAADVPLVTEEALEAFLVQAQEIIGQPPKPRHAASIAPPRANGHDTGTDTEEALDALYAIPGSLEYDEWVRVGMALYSALGPAGEAHWMAWSARSPKNQIAVTAGRWRSFHQVRDIKPETLFWFARENGWKPKREKGPNVADLSIFKARKYSDTPDENGEFKPIEETPAPGEIPKANALPLRFWADLDQPVPPDKLVRRLFGINTLVEIYGPTASGKTFLTLDIAMHIALGRDWFGRPVTKGAVLYVASEGGASIENRLLAFRQHHGIAEDVPIAVVPVGVNLGPGGKDAARVIEAAKAVLERYGIPVLLVVIDTLARSMAGNENDAVNMGAFIMACDGIRMATGATVLVVHHSGKDPNSGSRGSTALPSAVDTLLKSEKGNEGHVATIEKQKDGVEGTRIGFTLKMIEIGTDEETGEPITSCVVVPVAGEAAASSGRRREPSGNAGVVLKALYMAVAESGEDAPASVHVPPFARVVPTDRWRDYAYRMLPDATAEARKKAFKRASSQLVSGGWVGSWTEKVWISK